MPSAPHDVAIIGAGIAGLAVGFGAQNLVRDVISGFFIILEDQVRIGDIARINNVTGSVEHINLRTIVLRDSDGAVQVFPNGSITALANLSKQYSYAVVDVRVAYAENMDRVFGSLREVGVVMARDPAWRHLVLGPQPIVRPNVLQVHRHHRVLERRPKPRVLSIERAQQVAHPRLPPQFDLDLPPANRLAK